MTAARRIIVVRLKPRIPSATDYAELNPSDKSALVTLSGGNLTATTTVSTGRVRADLGLTVGSWYWETRTTANGGTVTRGGLARSSHPIATALGENTISIGGPDASGNVRFNGADTALVGAITTADTVGHWFDTATGTYRVRKNNGAWAVVVSGTDFIGQAWYPALQNSAIATHIIRTDPATFVYDAPAGVRQGLYHSITSTPTDLYVSSDPYVAGSPLLLARLSGAKSELVVERHAKLWPWSQLGTDRRGRLVVLNGDRRLDAWEGYGWRDAEYEILVGDETDDFSGLETWSKGVVDSFGWDDRCNIVLELADPLARLDKPLQPSLYPVESMLPIESDNPQIAGKPEPITLGPSVRMFPVLLSTDVAGGSQFTYAVHDDAVNFIEEISDRGDPLEQYIDWNYLPDRSGFQLVNQPDNPVSAVVTGGMEAISTAVPRSGVDSDFVASTWSGSPLAPTGWDNTSSGGGSVTDSSGATFLTTTTGQVAGLIVTLPGSGARRWRVDMRMEEWISGEIRVVGDPSGSPDPATVIPFGSGNYVTAVVLASSAIEIRNPVDGIVEYTISEVQITEVSTIDRLPEWMRYLCVTRGGFDVADVDIAAAEALDEKAPYLLGWSGSQSIMILKLLRMAMDSFTGWVTSTREGLVTVGRLEADKSAPVAFSLNSTNIKTIAQRNDVAESFTRRMGASRNYAVHSGGDIVPSASQELQAVLMSEWGVVREAGALNVPTDTPPAGASLTDDAESNEAFKHAIGAPLQETLLFDVDYLPQEINRVAAIIGGSELRWWNVVAALSRDVADSIEIGQRVTITMPIEGLENGRDATILGAVININSSDVQLTLLEYPEVS
jgi:hypothetical protein